MRIAAFTLIALVACGLLAWVLLGDPIAEESHDHAVATKELGTDASQPVLHGQNPHETPNERSKTDHANCKIHVTVRDSDGAPAAGVAVEVRSFIKPSHDASQKDARVQQRDSIESLVRDALSGASKATYVVAAGVSDGDGRITFDVCRGRRVWIQAKPTPPLVSPRRWILWPREQTSSKNVTLVLARGAAIEGQIVSRNGSYAGTRFSVSGKSGWTHQGTCDPETGTFQIAHAPSDSLTFHVTTGEGRNYGGFDFSPPFKGPLRIQLPSGTASLRIVATNEAGSPVANAAVHARVSSGDAANPFHTRLAGLTDDMGVALWKNASAGRLSLVMAACESYVPYVSHMRTGQGATKLTEGQITSVPVTLSQGGSIEGVVTRVSDSAVLSNATILLRSIERKHESPISTRSDEQGRFRFEMVGLGSYILFGQHKHYFDPSVEGLPVVPFSSQRTPAVPSHLVVSLTANDRTVTKNIALKAGATLAGRVLDEHDHPVEGARITIEDVGIPKDVLRSWGGFMTFSPQGQTTSDAEGRFALVGLAPRSNWQLYAVADGYAGTASDPVSLQDGPRDDVILRVVRGAEIHGHVVDGHGKPLVGVRVLLSGNVKLVSGERFAVSGAHGEFSFRGLAPEAYALKVFVNRRLKTWPVDTLSLGEHRSGVKVIIKKAKALTGTLQTTSGDPLANTEVALLFIGTTNTSPFVKGLTDEHGRFRLESDHKGNATLYVLIGGDMKPVGPPVPVPFQDEVFTFDPPKTTRLSGQVKRSDEGGIGSFTLNVREKGGGHPRTYSIDGTEFSVEYTGEAPILIDVLHVKDERGLLTAFLSLDELVEDPTKPIQIALRQGATVSGKALDEQGSGVAGVLVRHGQLSAVSAQDGSWTLTGMPVRSGHTRVSLEVVVPPGFVPVPRFSAKVEDNDVEIRLKQGLMIRGRVVLPKGIATHAINLTASFADGNTGIEKKVSSKASPTGVFEIGGFPAGEHVKLQVEPVQSDVSGDVLLDATLTNIVPGTEDLVVRLQLGVTIAGTIVDHAGSPLTNVAVRLAGKSRVWTTSNRAGKFRLLGVPPGASALSVVKGAGNRLIPDVSVRAPSSDVRIVVPNRARISGSLMGADDGGTWSLRAYNATAHEEGTIGHTPINEDGSWTTPLLGMNTKWLIVATSSKRRNDRYAVAGPVDAGATGVVLTVKQGKAIQGRVEIAGKGSRAFVEAEGRGWRSHTYARANGEFTLLGLPPGTYVVKARDMVGNFRGQSNDIAAGATDVLVTLHSSR